MFDPCLTSCYSAQFAKFCRIAVFLAIYRFHGVIFTFSKQDIHIFKCHIYIFEFHLLMFKKRIFTFSNIKIFLHFIEITALTLSLHVMCKTDLVPTHKNCVRGSEECGAQHGLYITCHVYTSAVSGDSFQSNALREEDNELIICRMWLPWTLPSRSCQLC